MVPGTIWIKGVRQKLKYLNGDKLNLENLVRKKRKKCQAGNLAHRELRQEYQNIFMGKLFKFLVFLCGVGCADCCLSPQV